MSNLKRVFFGYPSQPAVEREAVATAAARLAKRGIADTRPWEQFLIGGRVVVDVIESEIRAADLAVFDVTNLNQNVLYELGYAVGAAKPVWLLRDTTDAEAAARWRRLGLLSTIGHRPFTNADDIVRAFLTDRPDHNPVSVYEESVAPALRPSEHNELFHIPTSHDTEIDLATGRELMWCRRRGFEYVAADVRESGIQPLTWYGQHVYNSVATVVNLMPQRRRDADVHDALASLVAGLARGMGRPVLLVAEEDWPTPIDFRDLAHVCHSTRDCESHVASWLDASLPSTADRAAAAKSYELRLELATELAALRLGDPVAENEEAMLSDYFVETAAYLEVLAPKTTVFVGSKGTGKTANFIRAAEELASDARILVGFIKPVSYEWQSVLRALARLAEHDLKDYVAESLWEYLLLSEIAILAANAITERPATPLPGSPQDRLLALLEAHPDLAEPSFSIRLERITKGLNEMPATDTVDSTRQNVAAILHSGVLRELKDCLAPALSDKDRVAILIDNLDKAWQRDSAQGDLGHFLLGLLAAAPKISQALARRDKWKSPAEVTIALFLRADIFDHLSRVSREPDKLPVTRLAWDDSEALMRVIEERYVTSRGKGAHPGSLWTDYFCPTVRGTPTRLYMMWRILPKPRDLIQMSNAALAVAINRRHGRIEEEDIITAESQYSQFAHSVLLVEDEMESGSLADCLLQLAGSSAFVQHGELVRMICPDEPAYAADLVNYLLRCRVLGVEVRAEHFEYADEQMVLARNIALARKLASERGTDIRYGIHPAFRPYLGIADPDIPQTSP